MMTPATLQKRQALKRFIETELRAESAVRGVIGIGSIASGLARPDSDIDAIVFLAPYDGYILPAEFKWSPVDRTFHSIFSEQPEGSGSLEFDVVRLDLAEWSHPAFEWPEGRCAELQNGWSAFDRAGEVGRLIAAKTEYTDELRLTKLDEAITWLDQRRSPSRAGNRDC